MFYLVMTMVWCVIVTAHASLLFFGHGNKWNWMWIAFGLMFIVVDVQHVAALCNF